MTNIPAKFSSEKEAIDYFIEIRYNGVLTCPRCGSTKRIYRRNDRPKLCYCKDCNYSFSVFKGTVFEKSRTPISKWFAAFNLLLMDKKGMPALELQRYLSIFTDKTVTYKCAWRIMRQVRKAMGNIDPKDIFDAKNIPEPVVEIDETYVGPKPRKTSFFNGGDASKQYYARTKRGRGTDKTPIAGIYDRNSDKVYAKIIEPNETGKTISGEQLKEFLDECCGEGTIVMTDEFRSYNILDRNSGYRRHTVIHSRGQYSAGGGIHTNRIEGFWSLLKRGGLHKRYHRIDRGYLQSYINEYCFRFNHRNNNSAFETLLWQAVFRKTG